MEKVRSASQLRQAEAAKDAKRKLSKDKKRIAELDTIIKKLYESFAVGRITDERFDSLLADYEAEQKMLQASVTEAEERLSAFTEDTARVEQFLELARKYTDFSELTTPMINEFIGKIIVHARSASTATGCRRWRSICGSLGGLSCLSRSWPRKKSSGRSS